MASTGTTPPSIRPTASSNARSSGSGRAYAALAPLVGLTAGGEVELGPGLRVRPAASGEFAAHWPEAARLLPRDYGREVDRTLLIELERELELTAAQVPDAPAELGRAVSALRLATPGAIAAGPVLFERLDWRPYDIKPVPPLAAQAPPGEPTRLDAFRGRLAERIVQRLAAGPADPDLLEAVERFEIALFNRGPLRADELREALVTLLGGEDGPWAAAMRAAAASRRDGLGPSGARGVAAAADRRRRTGRTG